MQRMSLRQVNLAQVLRLRVRHLERVARQLQPAVVVVVVARVVQVGLVKRHARRKVLAVLLV